MTDRINSLLASAGLDFGVVSEPLSSPSGPVVGRVMRRDDTGLQLGRTVSGSYSPLDHLEAFSHIGERIDRLETQHGPARIDIASDHGGATARMLIAFPESPTRERSMKTHLYPAALFTHGIGGTAGLTGRAGTEVSVCMNGLFLGESLRLATRHTVHVRKRLVSLGRVMEKAIAETEEFAHEMDDLSRVCFSPEYAYEAISYINRGKVIASSADELTPKELDIFDSLLNGPGNAMGSAASLLQAVTHYTTHKAVASERLELDSANAQQMLTRARHIARLAAAQSDSGWTPMGQTATVIGQLRLETA